MKSISLLFLILLTTFQIQAQNSIKLYQGKALGSEEWTKDFEHWLRIRGLIDMP
ncbi:hypothetical protein [Fontibacter flavus]|uniref:Uncharacterized protein n=1 Tax=Fontibacter flavus TaxID=654838 RepID=A0ABV6FVA0_9BACT